MAGIGGGGGNPVPFQMGQTVAGPSPRVRPLFDLLQNAFIGELTTMPEIPIPVPLQQAISAVQDLLPNVLGNAFGGGGIAGRLQGSVPAARAGGGGRRLDLRGQDRVSLGLPATRRELFGGDLALPTTEEAATAGLFTPPRPTPQGRRQRRRLQRLERREERVQGRIERREGRGAGTARAQRRLERIQRRLERRRAVA